MFSKGKVQLPLLSKPPDYLLYLIFDRDSLESKCFQENIRAYNMVSSFTSLGGFVFRLSRQNHHRVGILLPMDGKIPKFTQLYIYDTTNEVSNRVIEAMR